MGSKLFPFRVDLGALFPFRVDSFLEGIGCAGKQTGSHKCFFRLLTMAANLPSLSIKSF